MIRFYDPKDEQELAQVERLLRGAGVEYFLTEEPEARLGPKQVQVAEEDLPTAEAALRGYRQQERETSTVLPTGDAF
ncbi:MAG: hypothetical protein IH614_20500 [Desulfuromonadales bacterium]|nr:hypothetical protein [Desulfuromonadales bacterium]